MVDELETSMRPADVADFRRVIAEARVGDQILLNERAMGRMVGMVQWILRRVGEDGIRLTSSGYLPPAVVLAATAELDWGWPMSVNRESHMRTLTESEHYMAAIACGLSTLGWLHRSEDEVSTGDARALVLEKWRLLSRLDVFARDKYGDSGWTPTAAGAAFARAALQGEATQTVS